MNIYNSLTRKLEVLKAESPIIMYVCGLTPYDSAHIGHTRTYVAFDVFKRYLIHIGYKIFHIQNITDVDDKIIKRSKETGEDPKKLVARNHDEALEFFGKLNIMRADEYPKVTEHIKEIIELIEKLIGKKYAYETETGVYYKVEKFKNYGILSGQKIEDITAGTRIEIDETKHAPEDFALWKKTSGEIIEFESPFGRGRPGWHIECSAMALEYAKKKGKNSIDIHGGARDLIFPHHENEIAQSESATETVFCRYWAHTGFLTVEGEKMSKSLGNFITVRDVVKKFSANAIRLFFIQTHYRSPIDYNEEQIDAAEESVERIFNSIGLMKEIGNNENKDKKFRDETDGKIAEFYKNMDNDFDTPAALAVFFDLLRIINVHISGKHIDSRHIGILIRGIEKILWIFGLEEKEKISLASKLPSLNNFLASFGENTESIAEKALKKLIEKREEFRKRKDYKKSDMIRSLLKEIGIIIEDREGKEARWRVE